MGMIDWGAVAGQARRACGGYLNDLFAVAAAAPGDPRVPMLDEVAALLSPDALRARMSQVPPYHPRRGPLGERVRVSASLLEADPAAASFLAGQLAGLRASVLGRWLRPASESSPAQVSLGAVVRERAVAFFPLDQSRYGRSARMIANLVALDLAAVLAEARRLGTAGDGLAWFGDAGAIAPPALAGLIAAGSRAGLATVASTVASPVASTVASPLASPVASTGASPGTAAATARIAALANVLVIRGPGAPVLPGIRRLTRPWLTPAWPARPWLTPPCPAAFWRTTSSPSWSGARGGRWCRGAGSCRAGCHDQPAGRPGVPRLGVRAGASRIPGRRRGGPSRPARSSWTPAGCWLSSGRNAASACR